MLKYNYIAKNIYIYKISIKQLLKNIIRLFILNRKNITISTIYKIVAIYLFTFNIYIIITKYYY